METHQSKRPPQIIIILIAVAVTAGAFMYLGVPLAGLDEVFTTSAQKCEAEVRAGIEALNPRRINVVLLETKSFGSSDNAGAFLLERGYRNELGHATLDVSESEDSKDLSVAIIALRSRLPSREDEGQLVTMELTQPIACVDGAIAQRSKVFLTETLENEPGVRAAIYQIGRVIE